MPKILAFFSVVAVEETKISGSLVRILEETFESITNRDERVSSKSERDDEHQDEFDNIAANDSDDDRNVTIKTALLLDVLCKAVVNVISPRLPNVGDCFDTIKKGVTRRSLMVYIWRDIDLRAYARVTATDPVKSAMSTALTKIHLPVKWHVSL